MEVDPALRGNPSLIALVTGGNRGIGLECVRRLCEELGDKGKVVMCARNRPQEVLDGLHKAGHKHVHFHQLDVASERSVNELLAWCRDQGGVDILVNNAGIAFKTDAQESFSVQARLTVDTNFLGTKRMMDAFLPIMKPHGRIVNVSSQAGAISGRSQSKKHTLIDPDATPEGIASAMEDFVKAAQEDRVESSGWWKSAYGVSKAGVTQLTRVIARDTDGPERKVFIASCCPGLTRTDMTGGSNTIVGWVFWAATWVIGHSAYAGADTPVWLAVLPWERTAELHGKFVQGRVVKPY